jgi:hypothetical protein
MAERLLGEDFVSLKSFQVGPKTLDEVRIPYVELVLVLLICRRRVGDIPFGKLCAFAAGSGKLRRGSC